jgi:hypothetical protein
MTTSDFSERRAVYRDDVKRRALFKRAGETYILLARYQKRPSTIYPVRAGNGNQQKGKRPKQGAMKVLTCVWVSCGSPFKVDLSTLSSVSL